MELFVHLFANQLFVLFERNCLINTYTKSIPSVDGSSNLLGSGWLLTALPDVSGDHVATLEVRGGKEEVASLREAFARGLMTSLTIASPTYQPYIRLTI